MLRSSGFRKLVFDRLVPAQSLDKVPIHTRLLSSMPPKKKGSAKVSAPSSGSNNESNKSETRPKQPFVNANLSPGEWDMNRTDPFFRPRPSKQANFISAEDFANRPPVGFDGEFHSYQDAMISLSWMDQKTCRAIYSNYVDMMVMSQQKHQTTSHEYVTRVIAQKYQITPSRAAGIIQLQHAEEQMRQHSPELLCNEQAKYAEETIQENIRDAYRAERQPGRRGDNNPNQSIPFIEDPVGIHGRGEPDETSTSWTKADDMYDMEQKLEHANVRDEERARLLIDGHVYQQDKDENQEPVLTDSTCRRLIKANEKHQKEQKEGFDKSSGVIPYPESNTKGERRDRWKFVAKVVNTRNAKKQNRRSSGYTNNSIGNTLVEHNGELRVATVEEAKEAAWKTTRTRSNEYLYEGAKKAWLNKTLHGKTNVWGAPPKTRASDSTTPPKKAAEAKVAKDQEKENETSTSTAAEAETDESLISEKSPEHVKEDKGEGGMTEVSEKESKEKE